jgi:hypothetical protein
VDDFILQILNGGGAGVGVTGLLVALYKHFDGKLTERDKVKLVEELARKEYDAALTLANSERDRRLEIANVKNELHEQRLNIQGEFIDRLCLTVENLSKSVSELSADVRALIRDK